MVGLISGEKARSVGRERTENGQKKTAWVGKGTSWKEGEKLAFIGGELEMASEKR